MILRESIVGYPVTCVSISDCLHEIVHWVNDCSQARYLVCANPHSIEMAQRDPGFKKALIGADVSVPDGFGIVLASRILGGQIRSRITGYDVFWGLNQLLNERSHATCFFLGSTDATLYRISSRMASDFPQVRIVGTFSPPFRSSFTIAEESTMIAAVNKAKPDVLWVGMTAPKQEKWIWRNRRRLDVKFIGAVGAVFDFYTGNVKRSPVFLQELGMEWLPRLLQQPGHLWKRMLISAPRFMLRVLNQKYTQCK